VQVFSAICVMFAHGANDSGLAAGPLAGIYTVYKTGTLPKKVMPELWILFMVAFALVLGLATYGYNVTRAMGTRMAKLSPSRGFAAELSTAMVIMIASQYGMPTSTSQAITGGIVGVALCEGAGGLNWRFFAVQFGSWVGTVFVCAGVTALLFAQGVYAPSRATGRNVRPSLLSPSCPMCVSACSMSLAVCCCYLTDFCCRPAWLAVRM
jgi:solute carrier family 20 (sodium-dependent phosphate transporter)